MKSRNQQSGITLISLIILLALILFVVWFGIKLFPIYLEYYAINKSMNTVVSRVKEGETPEQMRLGISNLFTINGVNDVSPRKNVTIAPSSNGNSLILTLDYDSRTNFIGNVDLIVHFHKIYRATPH